MITPALHTWDKIMHALDPPRPIILVSRRAGPRRADTAADGTSYCAAAAVAQLCDECSCSEAGLEATCADTTWVVALLLLLYTYLSPDAAQR